MTQATPLLDVRGLRVEFPTRRGPLTGVPGGSFRLAPGEVKGVVENARKLPVANTGVLVFPRGTLYWVRTNRRMRIAYTDREGRFSIAGLPAGEYLAVASLAADESDLGRRDRLRAWQDLATPFALASDSGRATVTLPLVAPPSAAAAVR